MKRIALITLVLSLGCLGIAAPVLAQSAPPAPDIIGVAIIPGRPPTMPFYLWTDSGEATDYDIEVYDSSDTLIWDENVPFDDHCALLYRCGIEHPTPLDTGQYSFRVIAHNTYGYSSWSAAYEFYLNTYAVPAFPIAPSPTPIATYAPGSMFPTPIVLVGQVYNILATTEYGLRTLPDDIRNPGLPIVTNPDGLQLFGYAKWLMSPFGAREVFGPFSDMGFRIGNLMLIELAFVVITMVVYFASTAIRFVTWLIRTIRSILPI